MKKTVIVDDFDGSAADETIVYSIDGRTFEIDLTEANAEEFRGMLAQWTDVSREVKGKGKRKPKASSNGVGTDREVRAWATAKGIAVNSHGRLPTAIREAYASARR